MAYTPRTTWAELVSHDALFRYVRRSGLSYRDLAVDVERELTKIARNEKRLKRDDGSVPRTCSHALIGQLIKGRAKTVHELRGVAIERALGVPDGDLFVPRVVHVARNNAAS